MSSVKAQIDTAILRRVHSNIQGYELKKALDESESLKTSLIIDKIEGLDLQCQLSYVELPVDLQYPSNEIKLFGFRRNGLLCGEIIKTKTISDGRNYNIFLIGIDTASKETDNLIKYISGQMFLDNISIDFELDENIPSTYIDYIKLKMFDLQVDQLKFLKGNQGKLIYQAYSNFEKKKLTLSVDTKSLNKKIRIETWL